MEIREFSLKPSTTIILTLVFKDRCWSGKNGGDKSHSTQEEEGGGREGGRGIKRSPTPCYTLLVTGALIPENILFPVSLFLYDDSLAPGYELQDNI